MSEPEAGTTTPRARPAAPTPADIAPRFPGLEIEETIGQGGMGVVYRARHKKLDRRVALKILAPELSADPAFAERFLREARAMARLDHPNIVAVYDFGETDGLCWLLMEHVDGVNLRSALNSGTLTPERALAIVPQLCDALQSAHDLGIVHRDIKPENVLFDREGRVKIADFGLAKLSGEADGLALTQSDVGMGTVHYMAPEQLRGAHAVDHRADIYSLGVVFYEMLTGQLPIGRFELPSTGRKLDTRVDDVVMRALENEPARRYQQANEVKTDVQAIPHASVEQGAAPMGPAPSPASPPSRAQPPVPSHVPGSAAAFVTKLAHEAKRGSWMLVGLCAWPLCVPAILFEFTSWGILGLALIVAQSVVWLYLLTRYVMLARTDSATALAGRSTLERVLRATCFAVAAAIGLTALGAGFESIWELGTDQHATSTSAVRALKEPWNEEYGYQLLQLLPEHSAEGAVRPELGTPLRDRWLREELPTPAGTFLIAFVALWSAGIASSWRQEKTDWRGISTPVMGVLVLLGYAWVALQIRQSGEPQYLHGLGGSLVIDTKVADARSRVADRLMHQEFDLVVEVGETIVEKRARSPITRHELLVARPRMPLDRWRYTRNGPRRVRPGVVIELVGSAGGDKTYVTWNAGLLRDGEPLEAVWRRDIAALFR